MKTQAGETAAAWRTVSWTLLVVLLAVILLVSSVPWIARKATTTLVATLNGQ